MALSNRERVHDAIELLREVVIDTASVLVRPEVVRQQEEADQAARVPTPTDGEGGGPGED